MCQEVTVLAHHLMADVCMQQHVQCYHRGRCAAL